MNISINRINAELISLGHRTHIFESILGTVVSFIYLVGTGPYKDERFFFGVSMQGVEPYPEYPPHWVHVSPPITDHRGGLSYKYSANGLDWLALSRPPGEIWDKLPEKNMKVYITEHLHRFWHTL